MRSGNSIVLEQENQKTVYMHNRLSKVSAVYLYLYVDILRRKLSLTALSYWRILVSSYHLGSPLKITALSYRPRHRLSEGKAQLCG